MAHKINAKVFPDESQLVWSCFDTIVVWHKPHRFGTNHTMTTTFPSYEQVLPSSLKS